MLRLLRREETAKRGCFFCADMEKVELDKSHQTAMHCPFAKCPYRELDGNETYSDYLKDTEQSCGLLNIMKGE